MGSKRLLNSTARRESERLKESEPLLRDRNKPRISGWRRRLSFAPFIDRLEDAGGEVSSSAWTPQNHRLERARSSKKADAISRTG